MAVEERRIWSLKLAQGHRLLEMINNIAKLLAIKLALLRFDADFPLLRRQKDVVLLILHVKPSCLSYYGNSIGGWGAARFLIR